GHVEIESHVGVGTTVRIYLPRHVEVAMINGLLPDAPGVRGMPRRAEAEKTVFVIEDELPIRRMIAGVLIDLGYTVLQAEDGPQALRMLDGVDRVDLLVTDVGLPGGVNGRQVADAVRVRHPAMRVLFIT